MIVEAMRGSMRFFSKMKEEKRKKEIEPKTRKKKARKGKEDDRK